MKTIFKVGDKVFDYNYGWGEVAKFDDFYFLVVKFKDRNVGYEPNGCRPSSHLPTLSFTEYTLEGFSVLCAGMVHSAEPGTRRSENDDDGLWGDGGFNLAGRGLQSGGRSRS